MTSEITEVEVCETITMNDHVEPFLIPETHTIRQAMEQLEKTEEKIIFVVNEASRLVGSLTDGDIRRWILSDGNLKAEVRQICNRKPFVVEEGYRKERVRNSMLKRIRVRASPQPAREIVQLLFWKRSSERPRWKSKTRKLPVVIMAGGQGTRLAPFTSVLPKPLIPVGDRTIVEIIIDQFLPYGLNHFHLSINYKSKILKSFFEELAPKYSVAYLEENEPRGTAGGLRPLYSSAPESLIVTNCDIVIQADYAELVAFHTEKNYDLTLVASLKEYRIPYGVCQLGKSGGLEHITEKPQYSFLVNTGMYVVRRDRLDLIPEHSRCDMTDFIERIKNAGGRVGVYPISENAWVDTGEWAEYRKALENLNHLGSRST